MFFIRVPVCNEDVGAFLPSILYVFLCRKFLEKNDREQIFKEKVRKVPLTSDMPILVCWAQFC